MALLDVIDELKSFEPVEGGKKVLTIYLNTDRSECQRGSWKIKLKNGLKKLQQYIEAGSEKDEVISFLKVKKEVERTIDLSVTNLQKSLVIFVSEADELFSVHHLQVGINTEFFWEDKPVLMQIEKIQRSYPSSGVIIANDQELTLMHCALGQLEIIDLFEFEANMEDWRLHEGLAAGERMPSSANHRDQFQERLQANQQRWIKGILPLVEKKGKEMGWHFVNLFGQAGYINSMQKDLALPIKNTIRKTISSKKQNDLILKAVAN